MPERISIGKLLQELQPVFNTIDFRAAVIKDGDKWVNGLTAIRMTRIPKDDVAGIYQSLRSKWGDVNVDEIQFALTAIDFDECDQVFEGLRQGTIVLPDLSVDYPEPVDIAILETRGYGLRPEAYWPFRVGLATRQQAIRWEDFDASLAQGGSPLTTLQALNTLLGLEGFSSNNSTQVLVGVPVYATVRNHSFSAGGLELDVEFDGKLTGITLTAFTSIGDGEALRGLSTLELTPSNSTDIGDGLWRLKNIVQLEAREHDKLNLRLTHKPTAHEIESRRNDIRYYLQRQDKPYDPMATIFLAFCDYDLLEQYLAQPTPELARGAGIAGGVQSLFEQAVAWFLALMGFRIVREQLRKSDRYPEYYMERPVR